MGYEITTLNRLCLAMSANHVPYIKILRVARILEIRKGMGTSFSKKRTLAYYSSAFFCIPKFLITNVLAQH